MKVKSNVKIEIRVCNEFYELQVYFEIFFRVRTSGQESSESLGQTDEPERTIIPCRAIKCISEHQM